MKLLNIALFLCFWLLYTENAQAYLDPGTGSFIFQLIIGGFLGGILAIKLKFRQIKAFLSVKKGSTNEISEKTQENEEK